MDKYNAQKTNTTAAKKIASNSKSWTSDRSTGTAEKRNKQNRRETALRTQCADGVKSPCLYCKSWMNAPDNSVGSKYIKPSTAPHETPKKILRGETKVIRKERNVEAISTGPNPYAPHLKYGIFPHRSPQENRNTEASERPKSPMKRRFAGVGKEIEEPLKEDPQCEGPLFSVRPLDDHDRGSFASHKISHRVTKLPFLTMK